MAVSNRSSRTLREALSLSLTHTHPYTAERPCGGLLTPTSILTTLTAVSQLFQGLRKMKKGHQNMENTKKMVQVVIQFCGEYETRTHLWC